MWAPAAAGASGRRYDDLDLAWVRRELGWYILEVADAGHLRYRLWHEVVADHLRGTRDACRTHEAIASALIRRVPRGAAGRRDWTAAQAYAVNHLATHAASGGVLDELLDDPGYLLHAAGPALLAALPAASSGEPRAAAEAYRSVAAVLAHPSDPEDISRLELAAHQTGANRLAAEVAAARLPRPWATRWATWSRALPARTLAGGHAGAALAVAAVRTEGGLLVVTGGDDATVRVWDVGAGRPTGPPLVGPSGPVIAVAVIVWRGRPVAVTAGGDGAYRWNLDTGEVRIVPGTRGGLTAVALAALGDRCVLVAGTREGGMCAWDLDGGKPLAALSAHAGAVRAIAVGRRPTRSSAVVSIGTDQVARMWDLDTGDQVGQWPAPVETVAAAMIDGRAAALTVDPDLAVRMWNLEAGHGLSEALTGNSSPVAAAALADRGPSHRGQCEH